MILSTQKPAAERTDVGRPRTGQIPIQNIRIPRRDWGIFHLLLGRQSATVVREFIRWYLRMPGAKLPDRPTREEIERATERWAEENPQG